MEKEINNFTVYLCQGYANGHKYNEKTKQNNIQPTFNGSPSINPYNFIPGRNIQMQ